MFVFEQDENIASMLTYCAKDIVDNLEVIDNMDIDKEKYPDARSFLYNKECEYEEIYRIYHHELSPFHGDNSAADDK